MKHEFRIYYQDTEELVRYHLSGRHAVKQAKRMTTKNSWLHGRKLLKVEAVVLHGARLTMWEAR